MTCLIPMLALCLCLLYANACFKPYMKKSEEYPQQVSYLSFLNRKRMCCSTVRNSP